MLLVVLSKLLILEILLNSKLFSNKVLSSVKLVTAQKSYEKSTEEI